MDRRDFLKTSSALAALGLLGGWEKAFALGCADPAAGKEWKGWKKGHFQVHFIYTGVAESLFFILPDGTTMLLDCGDFDALARGKLSVPVLPSAGRHAGDWIARYVLRVNPGGRAVDYMMLSHYHNDHAGCLTFNAGMQERDGKPYSLSGFAQAAEQLHFDKAIDRCWPDYSDPFPLKDDPSESYPHMRYVYEYLQAHEGLKMEKFELGAVNQVAMVNHPEKYPDFSIRNICVNGRICGKDGKVVDLYEDRKREKPGRSLNENGMSCGMIVSYGPFKFFTAGDFSDKWSLPDGSLFRTEDALASVCPQVDVAKLNHHGHNSMPAKLVSALAARVWVSCVWDQLHTVDGVLERLADRSLYEGDRIVCPGIFPRERREAAAAGRSDGTGSGTSARKADGSFAWLEDICPSSFEGGHIVLDVEPGGKRYSITYITAEDESMTVRSVMNFRTKEK